MRITRRQTRQVTVGNVKIGGGSPISIQSMTVPSARDVVGNIEQIHALEAAGCELVRVAVPDMESAEALPKIKAQVHIPIIADIHFDHRLALKAAESVDCVRINPGNIGAWWKVEEVVKAVNDNGIPLRIGVNGGSLERPLLEKYGYPNAEALSESALNAVHALEDIGFTNMKVSLKASDVHCGDRCLLALCQSVELPSPYRDYRSRNGSDGCRKVRDWAWVALISRHWGYDARVIGRGSG